MSCYETIFLNQRSTVLACDPPTTWMTI